MIDVVHVPIQEAVATAAIIVRSLGVDHELSIKWMEAVAKFGYRWRPERDAFMRSV